MLKALIRSRQCRAMALASVGLSGVAAPEAQAQASEDAYIFGGRAAQDCEWPNVGRVPGCTVTLISESIIVFAAHCGAQHKFVSFEGGKRKVKIKRCEVNEDFSQGTLGQGIDWGYCELEDTSWSKHVPLVPPLRQGELDQIKTPYPATLVGYGRNNIGLKAGKAAEVDTFVTHLSDEASIGGNGADSCQGDSGGPAFVQLQDGSWRALGITSYGGACGQGGFYSLFANAIPWIEERSGLKLPNCDSGESYACEALILDPGGDYGRDHTQNAQGHCKAGPLLEPGAARGIRFVDPSPGKVIEQGEGLVATLELEDLNRLPKARLVIELDGKFHTQYDELQKSVRVELSTMQAGQHVLRAKIEDEDGEVRNVARVAFRWAMPKPVAALSDENQASTETPAVKQDPQGAGCSLRNGSAGYAWAALGLLGLLRVSRRRIRNRAW